MHPILRNVLSLLAWIPGSIANMAEIILGNQVSPLPARQYILLIVDEEESARVLVQKM